MLKTKQRFINTDKVVGSESDCKIYAELVRGGPVIIGRGFKSFAEAELALDKLATAMAGDFSNKLTT